MVELSVDNLSMNESIEINNNLEEQKMHKFEEVKNQAQVQMYQ